MYSRFRRLDRGRKGTLTADDLQMIPELAMSPLAPRVIALFEQDCEDVNFKQFLKTLSPFRAAASASQKLNCGWGSGERGFGSAPTHSCSCQLQHARHPPPPPSPPLPIPQACSPCLTLTATASFPTRTLCLW